MNLAQFPAPRLSECEFVAVSKVSRTNSFFNSLSCRQSGTLIDHIETLAGERTLYLRIVILAGLVLLVRHASRAILIREKNCRYRKLRAVKTLATLITLLVLHFLTIGLIFREFGARKTGPARLAKSSKTLGDQRPEFLHSDTQYPEANGESDHGDQHPDQDQGTVPLHQAD